MSDTNDSLDVFRAESILSGPVAASYPRQKQTHTISYENPNSPIARSAWTKPSVMRGQLMRRSRNGLKHSVINENYSSRDSYSSTVSAATAFQLYCSSINSRQCSPILLTSSGFSIHHSIILESSSTSS